MNQKAIGDFSCFDLCYPKHLFPPTESLIFPGTVPLRFAHSSTGVFLSAVNQFKTSLPLQLEEIGVACRFWVH